MYVYIQMYIMLVLLVFEIAFLVVSCEYTSVWGALWSRYASDVLDGRRPLRVSSLPRRGSVPEVSRRLVEDAAPMARAPPGQNARPWQFSTQSFFQNDFSDWYNHKLHDTYIYTYIHAYVYTCVHIHIHKYIHT